MHRLRAAPPHPLHKEVHKAITYGTREDDRNETKEAHPIFGSCPAGYTTAELESFLHLLYGLFHELYTASELRGLMVSDPFDVSAIPRRIRLVDLAAWLEALVS